MRREDGRRFERFVRDHWTGDGGMRGLCTAAGIAPETLYRWYRGETEPDLGSIRQLAGALDVTRAEIVAAIDGQLPPPDFRQELGEAMRGFLREAQEAGVIALLPNPPDARAGGDAGTGTEG